MLGHKPKLNKFKRLRSYQASFSIHNTIRLEEKKKKTTREKNCKKYKHVKATWDATKLRIKEIKKEIKN